MIDYAAFMHIHLTAIASRVGIPLGVLTSEPHAIQDQEYVRALELPHCDDPQYRAECDHAFGAIWADVVQQMTTPLPSPSEPQ